MRLQNTLILRLDLLPGAAPGNKYFKLKHNLHQLPANEAVLSFGGAWSNHLHALAAVGAERNIATVGVVRGERPAQLSATLVDCENWGMHLHFVSRSDYRRRQDPDFIAELRQQYQPCTVIPEGGANDQGVAGCSEILEMLDTASVSYSTLAVACGTGATLAGLSRALLPDKSLMGIAVLKGASSLQENIKQWSSKQNWRLLDDYHQGGYAKVSSKLREFVLEFERVQNIPLDPVYTGKLMLALYQLQASGELDPRQTVVAIHSGGLQGRRGFDWLARESNERLRL